MTQDRKELLREKMITRIPDCDMELVEELLKEERNAVLSETNKEISTFWKQGAIIRLEDISTIINNLRVK